MTIRHHGLTWLAGALFATVAATLVWADDPAGDPAVPPPSAANQCGRLRNVSLTPIVYTHKLPSYPMEARRWQHGHVFLRLVVDKYGFARQPEVVISSGYGLLDQAAIDAIKDQWRWEPPPPECQDSGVIIGVVVEWGLGKSGPEPIYLDDPYYPAEARARKQGGTGKVEYTISGDNKVTDAHVTSSTGSPDLDAAMIARISAMQRYYFGVTPTTSTTSERIEFVPRDNPDSHAALMGPAIVPNPAELPPKQPRYAYFDTYAPPSLANGCGRSEPVFLEPERTNNAPPFPVEAASTGKEGRTVLDVLVDKGGTASEVTVAETSGSPVLDAAAVRGIKGLWHWQPPPPECADRGVRLRTHIDWFRGDRHFRVMPGDPGYPAEAIPGKLSGSGTVQITRLQDGELESTKVVTSINSPVLDAAMVKIMTDARFTPGTKILHKTWSGEETIDFVGDPDAMRAAAAAPTRRIAPPPPPPSAANDCGRSAPAYLAPVEGSHALVQMPTVVVKSSDRPATVWEFRTQGAVRMHVLVDKDGKAANVSVAQSSAPPEMERAVTAVVKGSYRWDPPPPECADRGVMLDVNYVDTWASPKLQIYADDPDYPDAARQRSMGAAGIVWIQSHSDEIDSAKILVSTNSPELDQDMIKVVSDRLLAEMRAAPRPDTVTEIFPVMFMPAFVASPGQQAARAAQARTVP